IMQAVTAKAREVVHADRTSIILLTATGDYFQTISLSGEANPAFAETLYPLAGTTAEIAVKQRRVVVITDPDLNTLPEMRRFTEQGLRSFMNVPLISGGSVIGALNVASRQPDAYTSRDENALSQIASLLAAALDNRRLFEQTERRAAQLEEATRFLDSVIENLPVMLFVKDAEELRFVRWNKAGEELVGFSRDDLLGKNDYDFFPKEEADFFTAKDREVLAGGQLLDIAEEPIQTAHRGARLLHTRKIPILGPDRGPKYLLGISEDITERKRAEAEILRHNEELAALNRVVSVVTSSFNQRVILHAMAREVVHIFGAQKSGIALLDAGRQNLVVVADHSNSPDEPSAVGLVIALENNPSSVQVIETKRGLVVPQAQTNPLTASAHAILRARNTHCLMIVPLLARGEVIGTIGVDATDPNRVFSPEEVALAETIAGQIASAIENSRLFEETQRRALELETVAQVSTAASTILQAEELLQTVVDLTKTRFGLYHAHIYLLDDATQTLVLSAGAGEVGRRMVAEGRRIPLGWEQSLVARAARARQGVVVNDVRESPDFLSHPLLPNTRSELAVPMIVGDNVLGVFDVQADSVNRFTEKDVRIQTTLAEQVAVALQNANLYAEQAATVARLRELDHLKSAFLANMSHELRTPLNSILGFTEVLLEELDGPLTSQMENDLKIVYKNGQHLLNLISDVLDMAKIEAGKMVLNPERFDLTEVLEEVLGLTHPLARAKSLELRLETEAPIADLQLEADRMRMRQVMINLVNNAIKFTEAGHVTVRAEQAQGAIRVSVEDTGLGIPPHQLESIFQEFTQVDTSTMRKAGGTGL
ncbi:MAG: GAF domain-containing protein, partial [Anaerolineales bacterium]